MIKQYFQTKKNVLPGFGLSMGITLTFMGLMVLLPLSTLFLNSLSLGWSGFWETILTPRVLASLKLTFGVSLLAAFFNAIFGLVTAWVLVRYSFPGKRIVNGLIDLPFALPTAVAGITLTTLYSKQSWLGGSISTLGIDVAFTRLGILVALIFISMPFVIRTLQPVLEDMDRDMEEAAATLGANRIQILRRVVLPVLYPPILTGFALSFARALGEYGSVIFISGNIPFRTEITSLMIISKLEQFDYAGATSIAVVMLGAAFILLLIINLIQWWSRSRLGEI